MRHDRNDIAISNGAKETTKNQRDYIHGKVLATELYDYKVDPLEKRNLIDDPDYSDVKRSMQTHLNQLVNN